MLVKHDGKDVKLPDFLIVGAVKSGTTSLHYYLKQHPDIFMPKVKELRFFAYVDTPANKIPIWLKEEKHGVFSLESYKNYFLEFKENQGLGENRNRLNNHRSELVWFTGLSASGKSTIAHNVERRILNESIDSWR